MGSQSQINVTLEEETVGIEEVVAVGYGKNSRKNLSVPLPLLNLTN